MKRFTVLICMLGLGAALITQISAAVIPPPYIPHLPVKEILSSGTAFVVDENGYILTNAHVIPGSAQEIQVVIHDQQYSAFIVQAQPDKDLALLKVSAPGLRAAPLGNSNTVEIGDQVVAIGCPERICGTVTSGTVANLGVTATFPGGLTLHNLIMMDLAITHGSSGGPLINMKGEVIGITMGGMEGTNFSFAIPINDAIPLLEMTPGFSRSSMGQATEELSIPEIARLFGSSMVHLLEARQFITLDNLLPEELIGIKVDPPPPLLPFEWATMSPDEFWTHYCGEIYLRLPKGVSVKGCDYRGATRSYDPSPGDQYTYGISISAYVIQLASRAQAQGARSRVLEIPLEAFEEYEPIRSGEVKSGNIEILYYIVFHKGEGIISGNHAGIKGKMSWAIGDLLFMVSLDWTEYADPPDLYVYNEDTGYVERLRVIGGNEQTPINLSEFYQMLTSATQQTIESSLRELQDP